MTKQKVSKPTPRRKPKVAELIAKGLSKKTAKDLARAHSPKGQPSGHLPGDWQRDLG